MAYFNNIPTTPADKQTEQSAAWAEANRELGGFSHFNEFAPYTPYLGFGPENGELDLSVFWEFGPIDNGWQGDLPTEIQPTLPEVPAHLQGYRR